MASFGWGEFDESELSSDDLNLQDVIDMKQKWVRYVYDFGDSWEHTNTFGNVRTIDTPMEVPVLLGSARVASCEDSGGANCYYDYVDMTNDPDYEKSCEYDEDDPVSWMEQGNFNPEDI